MTIALIIGGVLGYAFLGGGVGWLVYEHAVKGCSTCRSRRDCSREHDTKAFFFGLGWPLTIPIVAGMVVAERVANPDKRRAAKVTRKEREHERKIEELQAQQELVTAQRDKTLADVKFLVENGIHAEVPGLYDDQAGS